MDSNVDLDAGMEAALRQSWLVDQKDDYNQLTKSVRLEI
uniref:Uncharacterized protein n=1 Tax=Nelumbo nucifera TaxID=4432 RepID=A0A822YIG6_NELNU|nr:TPA_asm: hypothetical protein HUJ06_010132 [Nelumbo nucifera]